MMNNIDRKELYDWCRIPVSELTGHPGLKVPFRIATDSAEMGRIMAGDFIAEIKANNSTGKWTRAIVPCGPTSWYQPFREMVRDGRISLRNLYAFHMDECLDWEGRPLPRNHPYNFRTYMEENFYAGIPEDLAVPATQRYWLMPDTLARVRAEIDNAPIDIVLGGWGQDGHLAYNQARRHPYSSPTLAELRRSTIRFQENNWDTIIALAHRTFGAAYQFVPPMSITLGLREILSAHKIRVYSDTGAWKQTALRVALFGPVTPEYPMTLLQEHPDAMITATRETARHPVSEHPEWDLIGGEPEK